MASDGRLVKMEVDYSDTVEKRLPECVEMAQVIPRLEGGCVGSKGVN